VTAPTSIHPRAIADLLPNALALAESAGQIPSRNRLMREYKIGAPKAEELRTRVSAMVGQDQLALPDWDAELAEPSADPWAFADLAGPDPVDPDPVDPVDPSPDPVGLEPDLEPDPDLDLVEPGHAEPGSGARARVRAWLGRRARVSDEPERPATVDPVGDRLPTTPDPVDATPDTRVRVDDRPGPAPDPDATAVEMEPQVAVDGHPGTSAGPSRTRRAVTWPIVLLALPAFVAVWSGWVGLGRMTGFGLVDLLPGIVDPGQWATIDSAITLPIGVETYGAYALYVWLSGRVPGRVRRVARTSAFASLGVGALGQVAYHLLSAAGVTAAPWWITTLVACLPVAVLGMGAALAHLVRGETAAG